MTDQQPDPLNPREYVVGLPVLVTIDDNGWIAVEVDLSELSVTMCKDSESGPLGEAWDVLDSHETAVADSEVARRWVQMYSVRNEGFAPSPHAVSPTPARSSTSTARTASPASAPSASTTATPARPAAASTTPTHRRTDMAEFLRFYNVRYCERVEVDDEGAAQQIRELVDDSMEANIDEIEVLLRDHGKVVSDEYVGDCDDPDANIEED